MDGDVSRLALCALPGPNPGGPGRLLAVSFIQFSQLPAGNEGFGGALVRRLEG